MLVTAFNFKLDYQIQSGQVVVGKFDGKNPSIAYATTGGKILLHCPHEGSSSVGEISPTVKFLNFNRKITSLAAGALPRYGKETERDILFVGTSTNVLAYDVDRNADVFFRDVQDGVNTMVLGKFGTHPPMLLVGGNCSLLGFDGDGTESFWTVTGDNVSSLTICDTNNDGFPELIVGSDDFEIRIFRDEEVIEEITEVDKITFLKKLDGNNYAYALSNGTVGVYSGTKGRLWRAKTKHIVTSLSSFDINSDGVEELLIGWNNGAFHVRNPLNGDTMFKDKLSSPIAGIVVSDYRKDGKQEVIVCCESGEITGYLPADGDTVVTDSSFTNLAGVEDHKAILSLYEKKQELTNELKNLEKISKMSTQSGGVSTGGLSNNTTLSYLMYPHLSHECVALKIDATPNDVIIVNVIAIDSEGAILNGCDVLAITPAVSGKPAVIMFHPTKFNSCTLRIQTHVAARGASSQLHVYEKDIQFPKFSTFMRLPDPSGSNPASLSLLLGDIVPSEPTSRVVFKTNESCGRLADYINTSFLLSQPFKCGADSLRIKFMNVSYNSPKRPCPTLPDYRQPLHISASRDESDPSRLKVQIKCDFMDLAAEIIQDMAKFFKITELASISDFPAEMKNFEAVLSQVNDSNTSRINLAADMADESQMVKALIVRAEDSRLLADMKGMRRAYTELYALNNQLISNYNLRASNHETLLSSLKEVNAMIQRVANLRVGKAKSSLIADCRAAVKANDMDSLLRALNQGREENRDSSWENSSRNR